MQWLLCSMLVILTSMCKTTPRKGYNIIVEHWSHPQTPLPHSLALFY